MSLPEAGFPLAAAVSPRLHLIETVDSTNAKLLHDAAAAPQDHPHLSVVLTRDQRAGRGRLDRTWTAPPGTALAISVLLRVEDVPTHERGWIPLLAGEAMSRAVGAQAPDIEVGLKWPNDVLVEGRKISGILAEVLPADPFAVIVGAGVNTSMTSADLPVPTATSFEAMGRVVDEDRLVADYLEGLRDGVAALAATLTAPAVKEAVRAACTTLGRVVTVSLPDGSVLAGTAERIDDDGRLVVVAEGVEAVVAAGDVVHVR